MLRLSSSLRRGEVALGAANSATKRCNVVGVDRWSLLLQGGCAGRISGRSATVRVNAMRVLPSMSIGSEIGR